MVLTPRRWCQVGGSNSAGDGGKKAGRRGEHSISRKPLRRECRIASAEPVCSCAFVLCTFAHETAGAARTRCSLRPPIRRVRKFLANLGRVAPRDREFISSRHRRESGRPVFQRYTGVGKVVDQNIRMDQRYGIIPRAASPLSRRWTDRVRRYREASQIGSAGASRRLVR